MDNLYLGYGNPRVAYTLANRPLVVLVNGDDFTVVQGPDAVDFKNQVSSLTHHFCGIRYDSASAKLIASVPAHKHDHHAYNHLFDLFWDKTNGC